MWQKGEPCVSGSPRDSTVARNSYHNLKRGLMLIMTLDIQLFSFFRAGQVNAYA
jgi:hypothetical protein